MNKAVDKIWRSLQVPPATDSFTEEMVSELPSLAKRYFLHTIVPGTPLAASVHLKMSGTFRGKPNGVWMPMQAEQLITVPKGFVWKATIGSGFFRLMGADYYTNESSRMQFSLWGIVLDDA